MKLTKGIGPNTDIVSYKTNPLTSGPIRMTQSVWYILIAVVATLTVIVIGIIIFLLRLLRSLKGFAPYHLNIGERWAEAYSKVVLFFSGRKSYL